MSGECPRPCKMSFSSRGGKFSPYHDGKTWRLSVPDWANEYDIRVENLGNRLVKVVLSVDGLSVMDGKPASVDGSGYVVGPYGRLSVPGYRLNDDKVARFRFGRASSSYAAQVSDPQNVGVIGMSVFYEELPIFTYESPNPWYWCAPCPMHPSPPYIPYYNDRLYSDNTGGVRCLSMSGSEESTPQGQHLGTEFGCSVDHEVRRVNHRWESFPCQVVKVYYDSENALRDRGHEEKFSCTPPPGWTP